MKLIVSKPFDLPHKKFSVGQYEVVSANAEEKQVNASDLEHWFVKGCIAAGRAEIRRPEPQPVADPVVAEAKTAEGEGTQSAADPVVPDAKATEGEGTQPAADPVVAEAKPKGKK